MSNVSSNMINFSFISTFFFQFKSIANSTYVMRYLNFNSFSLITYLIFAFSRNSCIVNFKITSFLRATQVRTRFAIYKSFACVKSLVSEVAEVFSRVVEL